MARLVALALVVCVLAGTAFAANDAGTLRVGLPGEPDTLDPHKSTLIYARAIHNQIWLPLVTYDNEGALIPGAAERWEISPDKLTYTFHLRAGLRWSDGRSLDSSDFVYSFRRMMTPETLFPSAELYYWIENGEAVHRQGLPIEKLGVEAPDSRTLVIRLTTPNPFFLSLVAIAYAVPRHTIEAYGDTWTQADHIVTSGAYKVAARTPNARVDLVKNPLFPFADEVKIERVSAIVLGDEAGGLMRYRAGEIDLYYSVAPPQWDELAAERPGEAISYVASRTDYITFNTRIDKLNDERVRAALTLLIDRDVIANKIVGGDSYAAYGLVPPGWIGIAERTAPNFAGWPMDQRVAEARRLLSAAGYGEGNPLRIEFIYSGQLRGRMAIALEAMWGAAGIETTLLSKEVAGLFAAFDGGDFEAGVMGFDMGVEIDPYDVLAGFEPGGWADRSGYRSPAFESQLTEARKNPNELARAELLARAETTWLAGSSIAPIVHEPALWLIAPRVQGWSRKAQPYYWRFLTLGR